MTYRINWPLLSIVFGFLAGTPAPVLAGSIGGTSGGGGNVQIAEQVDNASYYYAIRRSRIAVESWLSFHYLEYRSFLSDGSCSQPYRANLCHLYGKLFDTLPTAIDLARTVEVEMKENGACADAEGNPTDGSVHGSKPGSICVSLARLRDKLRHDNYQNQISALALHELTHLKGTTEEEANALQAMMLGSLGVKGFSSIFNDTFLIDLFSYEIPTIFKGWMDGGLPIEGACQEAKDTVRKAYDFYRERFEGSFFRYLTPAQASDFWEMYIKARALQDYACSIDASLSAPKRDEARLNYERNFGSEGEMEVVKYAWSQSPGEQSLHLPLVVSPGVKMEKIFDNNSFSRAIQSLVNSATAFVDRLPSDEAREFKTYKTK